MPNKGIIEYTLQNNPAQQYLLYIPAQCGKDSKLLVAVHGNGRDVRGIAEHFAPFAERYGVILIAPYFTADRFQDYQFLGLTGQGERADHVLENIVSEVSLRTGADARLLYLLGYSAGAQFVHRFAMAYPTRVAKVVAGAAGWYTFPYPQTHYPSGIKLDPRWGDVSMVPEQFLKVPAFVFVGEGDTLRDKGLNQSPDVDEMQGTTRVERGRRWVEAMRLAARSLGYETDYRFMTVPEAAHSLQHCVESGLVGTPAFEFLFHD
jgi:pimeloyl-ACP methyl ester carboxylesterase